MKQCIMIVEDHDTVRNALKDWLTLSVPDCQIIEASGAEEALAAVKRWSPDVILMDISLPKMDGIEATRRIKDALPGSKIIVVSIHEDMAHRNSAMEAGAFAYVPKRVMKTELLPTIFRGLNEQQGSESEIKKNENSVLLKNIQGAQSG
jgi:DNA-binding NarL/FixJ family response regulator